MKDTIEDFVITRQFAAPRELLFRAWTEADRLAAWWGPTGFSLLCAQLDLRPGGLFHYCMRAAAGIEMWGRFVYREIAAPERLVFVNSFSDADGNIVRSPFSAEWPLEVLNTITFAEHEGATTITLRGHPIDVIDAERDAFAAAHPSLEQGFKGTLDRLDAYLAAQSQ